MKLREVMDADTSHPAAPLLRILQQFVLPALENDFGSHIVIARARRKQLVLPPNVTVVPLKLRGRRVAVRSSKAFQRAVFLNARWPQDGMHELRIPKFVFVVAGQTGFRAGDYILQCPAGTSIFLPSGVPHTDNTFSHLETLSSEVQSCSFLWLTPMMSGLACRMCHATGEEHMSNVQGEKVFLHRPQVMQLFTMLADEASREPESTSEAGAFNAPIFESLLLSLIRTIARDIHEEHFLLQEVPPHADGERIATGDPIEQAMQYLGVHYASTLSLDDMSRRFFLSRAQFTRKFRERTGQTFLEFLNARRLEQARTLLAETDWTAVMIARYVGFGSSAYFHRIFMRQMGISPMQFRAQTRPRNPREVGKL